MDKSSYIYTSPKLLVGIILYVMKYQTRVSKIHILNLRAIIAKRANN
jgi:hypothetical protein